MNKFFVYAKNNPFAWLSSLLVLGIALSRAVYLPEPDTLWQTRFGLDVIANGAIPRYDTYSWTMVGQPYTSNSWLWNVLLGSLYRIGGINTIPGVTFALVLAILSLLVVLLRKNGISWPMVFIGAAAFGIFSNVWLSSRPQLVDYASILLILIASKRLDFKTKRGFMMGGALFLLTITIWQNFHLSAPLGVLVIFFATLDNLLAAVKAEWRNAKGFVYPVLKSGAMAAFAAIGCFLTPFGLDGVLKGLDTSSASVGIISEWMTPISDFANVGWYSIVSVFIGVLAMAQTRKAKRPAYFVLVAVLVVLTCQQNRWSPFLAIISMVPFLQLLAVASYASLMSRMRPYIYAVSAAATVVFLGIGSLALVPHDVLSGTKTGYTVASHLPEGCKLFNADVTGGAIMLFRPDLKVSTDGRNDLYGRDRFAQYANLGSNPPQSLARLDQQQVTCVVTSPGRPLAKALESSSAWKMSYEDSDGFRVFLKEKP